MRHRPFPHGALADASCSLRPRWMEIRRMLDLLLIGVGLGSFAVMAAYAFACAHI